MFVFLHTSCTCHAKQPFLNALKLKKKLKQPPPPKKKEARKNCTVLERCRKLEFLDPETYFWYKDLCS